MHDDEEDKEIVYIFVLVFLMVLSFVAPIFIIPVLGLVLYVCLADDNESGDSSTKL